MIQAARLARAACLALLAATPAVASQAGARTWFVDNAARPGGDGSRDAPLDRLSLASRRSGPGDVIVVLAGDGTTRGLDEGIILQAGQRLVGEASGFSVAGRVVVAPGKAPTLSNDRGAVITLASGTTVEGVLVLPSAGPGIAARGASDVIVRSATVQGRPGAEAISLVRVVRARLSQLRASAMGAHVVTAEDVEQLSLVDVHVEQQGGGAGFDGVHATGLHGATLLSGLVVAGASDDLVDLQVEGADLECVNARFSGTAAWPSGNDALRISATGAAPTRIVIRDTTVSDIAGDAVQLVVDDAGGASTRADVALQGLRVGDAVAGLGLAADVAGRGALRLTTHAMALSSGGVLVSARQRGRLEATLDLDATRVDGAALAIVADEDAVVAARLSRLVSSADAPATTIESRDGAIVQVDIDATVADLRHTGATLSVESGSRFDVCVTARGPVVVEATGDRASRIMWAGVPPARATLRAVPVAQCPALPE